MKGLTTFCLFQIEYLFLNSNLFCFVVITLILKNGKIQYIIYKSGSRYFRYNSLNCRIKNAIFVFFAIFILQFIVYLFIQLENYQLWRLFTEHIEHCSITLLQILFVTFTIKLNEIGRASCRERV